MIQPSVWREDAISNVAWSCRKPGNNSLVAIKSLLLRGQAVSPVEIWMAAVHWLSPRCDGS